jgi:hypothetical protein
MDHTFSLDQWILIFAEGRHLFTADLFSVCWVTKEISKQYI